MLKSLYIQNLALVKELEIQLHAGFNVITGQSGAGKSLVLSALFLLRGGKASTHLIRTDETRAIVIGAFNLSKEEADTCKISGRKLEIKREISKIKGASKAFINGQKVTLDELRNIGFLLFDIFHQGDSALHFTEETQLEVLDQFAQIIPLKKTYNELYLQWEKIRQKLEKSSKIDPEVLAEEVNLLDEFSPSIKEYQDLEQERLRLENAALIRQTLDTCYHNIYSRENAILSEIGQVKKQLSQIIPYDKSFEQILQQVTEAECFLEESSFLIRDQNIFVDENSLQEVQNRISTYKEFFRKYTCSIESLISIWNSLAEQLCSIQHGLNEREALEKEEQEYFHKLLEIGQELHQKRAAVTSKFCYLLEEQLEQLGMTCRLEIVLSSQKEQLRPHGISYVEFLISTNKGEDLKPLSKIASGGERSRFILALKSLVDSQGLPIFVFDELDATLGNRFAKEVGQKLKSLAKNHQIISATHSPLVAAFGDRHFLVAKKNKGEKTYTKVQILEGEAKEQELLAMFQGEDGPLEIEALHKILIQQ